MNHKDFVEFIAKLIEVTGNSQPIQDDPLHKGTDILMRCSKIAYNHGILDKELTMIEAIQLAEQYKQKTLV